jgi:hypothetical protein
VSNDPFSATLLNLAYRYKHDRWQSHSFSGVLGPLMGCWCDIRNAETAMSSFPSTPSFFFGVYSTWSNRVRHVVSIVVLNFGSSRPWKSEPGRPSSSVLGYTDVSRRIAVQFLGFVPCLYPSCDFAPFRPLLISKGRWMCAVGELKRCYPQMSQSGMRRVRGRSCREGGAKVVTVLACTGTGRSPDPTGWNLTHSDVGL